MDIKELQEMNIHELVEVARGMNIEALSTPVGRAAGSVSRNSVIARR